MNIDIFNSGGNPIVEEIQQWRKSNSGGNPIVEEIN
jgi:hypothetical protein